MPGADRLQREHGRRLGRHDPDARRNCSSSQPYPNARYTHSGWWSEDGRYVYVHDELDEHDLGLYTTVRVFDMANLRAPVLAGTWTGPTRAIDHNGYVKGNRYYISNYSEGLTVLDITNPAAPPRIGYFDTFPASSRAGFVGAWGVYPFFASGTIAVGDINTGLYLLRDETLATPRGTFSVASAKLSGIEGQSVAINVNRSAGTGAVSVQLDVLYATASAADATLSSTTLNWADGDTRPKSATLNLAVGCAGRAPRAADGATRRSARRRRHRLSRHDASDDRGCRQDDAPAAARRCARRSTKRARRPRLRSLVAAPPAAKRARVIAR